MKTIDRTSLIVGVAAGLVVGLLLGMLLFWNVFPVRWTDAHSYDLAPDARAEFVGLVANSFKLDKNRDRVAEMLALWKQEEIQQAVDDAKKMYQEDGQADKVRAIDDLALVVLTQPGAGETELPTPPSTPNLTNRLRVPCLVFLFVLLGLVLGWIGLRVARKQGIGVPRKPTAGRRTPAAPAADTWEASGEALLGRFVTTYKLGEDTYDESFSIETPAGEFLGECGVGISDIVGNGEPDKVAAFEVWLFDKSDIRTVTKVLMSEQAFQDDALRARLASKGEAVLAQPDAPFTLETSGLQLRVDVTDVEYGDEDDAPDSHFARLTLELVATAKPSDDEASVLQ